MGTWEGIVLALIVAVILFVIAGYWFFTTFLEGIITLST